MTTGQHVLVVDGPTETEEVLRAVLEPQGLRVNRIRAHAPSASRPARPTVVVLHGDELASAPHPWGDIPRVIIGSAQLPNDAPSSDGHDDAHYLQKPYHYGELIRAIERLLARRPTEQHAERRSAG